MSIDEIRASDKPFLTPAEVAEPLGCDPQTVWVAARQAPELLGFNICIMGSRVKIPRPAFLRWYDGVGEDMA